MGGSSAGFGRFERIMIKNIFLKNRKYENEKLKIVKRKEYTNDLNYCIRTDKFSRTKFNTFFLQIICKKKKKRIFLLIFELLKTIRAYVLAIVHGCLYSPKKTSGILGIKLIKQWFLNFFELGTPL